MANRFTARRKRLGPKIEGQSKTLGRHAARKSAPAHFGVKKPHRYKRGTVALREVRKYSRTTEPLTARAPFVALAKSYLQEYKFNGNSVGRLSKGFIENARAFVESYMVKFMGAVHLNSLFQGKKGVKYRHVELVRNLRHAYDEPLISNERLSTTYDKEAMPYGQGYPDQPNPFK